MVTSRTNPDLEAPAGQEGVSDVLEQLFSYGTTGLDRLSFQKALDDIGANESAGASFSLQVLAASSTGEYSFWRTMNCTRRFPSRLLPRPGGSSPRRSRVSSIALAI